MTGEGKRLGVEDVYGIFRHMDPTWDGLQDEPTMADVSSTFKRMQSFCVLTFMELNETRKEVEQLRRQLRHKNPAGRDSYEKRWMEVVA